MAVHLHRARRTDRLADGLAGVLATPLADPFAEEVVVVPAKGIERWLTQRLSHRLGARPGAGDGVCAGVRFLTPNSLVTLLLGTDRDDPWLPDQLVWPLLATIDTALDEPWAHALATHLGHGDDGPRGRLRAARRYSVARRVAGLFHSYAVQRPRLLADWQAAGAATTTWSDGAGGQLDDDLEWQPRLWRELIDRLPAPAPPARHERMVRALRDGSAGPELPERLSLFGHTRLARTEIELLAALGTHHEVHLWLPHPAPRLWTELAGAVGGGPVPRADDRSGTLVHNPLLASLGRDLRELQRALAAHDAVPEPAPTPAPAAVDAPGRETMPRTWLQWLQDDLAADRQPPASEAAARAIGADDRSIQVHACHGPARQVEVLREVLLGLLADDPSLEPRDILIMCPDIESFAPLIQAAFGLDDIRFDRPVHPAHGLRVQLADRSLTGTNPLTVVAARLVELAAGRITARDLLDLAAAGPVRRRFAFSEDDLDQLSRWVEQAGIRWGLDRAHRARYGLGEIADNTWRAGLDRLLLGVALAGGADPAAAGVLPLDEVDSAAIDLAGRCCEFVDRVDAARTSFLGSATTREWMAALSDAVDALTDVPLADAWQRAELDRELGSVAAAATGDLRLQLGDVRTLLGQRLGWRPTRANFRTGGLTACTMVPMRSVPHRVIALLGLDDGVFPRGTAVDGDDVLARRPITGERDPRSEDRQLLLDAICAATDTLVVTYTGADPHTGKTRPPAVPLGELIDAARASSGRPVARPGPDLAGDEDRTGGPRATERAHWAPVRRHPLQSFDPANLAPAGPGLPPFSFDGSALRAALAARDPGPERPAGLALAGPLSPPPADDVDLAELLAFFDNPARAFLRGRLDVGIPLEDDPPGDAIPIELDALEKWAVGDRVVGELLTGRLPEQIVRAERLRFALPPRGLGQAVLDEVGSAGEAIAGSAAAVRSRLGVPENAPPQATDILLDLGGGRLLTGTVAGIVGNCHLVTTYSSFRAKQRLHLWISLLALSAGSPAGTGPWLAAGVGKSRGGASVLHLGPIPSELAAQVLRDLVAIRDAGRREPLPLFLKTAYEYAITLGTNPRSERGANERAREAWQGGRIPGDRADRWVRRVHGPDLDFAALTAGGPSTDAWPGMPAPYAGMVSHRLGQYALRLWLPAMAAGVTG